MTEYSQTAKPPSRTVKGPTSVFRTDLPEVLARVLRAIPEQPENQAERIGLFWGLAVGPEIARRSRVLGITGKTLRVCLAGAEWASPLKAMERKILARLNENLPGDGLVRIQYETGDIPDAESPTPAPRAKSPRPGAEPPFDTDPLNMIQDRELRSSLWRLSTRFRLVSVLLVSLFLANCAAMPKPSPIPDEHTPLMAQSEAVRLVQASREHDPKGSYHDPRAYFNYLVALKNEREGDFDEAAQNYQRVIQFDPTREDAQTKLVMLSLRTGRLEEALASGQDALKRFPDNFLMRMAVADILSAQGQHREAYRHYQKIIEKYPSNTRALLMAGYALLKLGDDNGAQELFQKTTLADPSNPLGYQYLGIVHVHKGQPVEAEEKFRKAISLRPSQVEARQNLARVLETRNNYDEAIQQYRIILKLDPENRAIREHLQKIHLIVQSHPSSGEVTEREPLPVLPWQETDVHLVLGAMFYEQAVYLEAIDEFRLVLAQREDKQIRLAIAKVFELFGRIDKSIQEVEAYRTRTKEPLDNEVRLHLARLYGLNQEMEKSVEFLSQAVTAEPENDRLYHALALAYMSLNDNEKAIENINRAISLNDKKDSYFFEQGALFERVGKYEHAIESMKQTLAINPNHSNAHNFIGYMYATMGVDLDKALSHLEQALVIQPKNGYFLDSLGWIYYKKGQPEEALTHIKRAMIYTEPDPVLYDHLGDVQFSLKNTDEAVKAWKTSLLLTLRKLKDPSGEIPDPDKLREKIRKASQETGADL